MCAYAQKKKKNTTIIYKPKYNIITFNCVFEFDATDTVYDMYCWRRGIPSCIYFFENKTITNHFCRAIPNKYINLIN